MQFNRQLIFALSVVLVTPVILFGQSSTDQEQLRYQRAMQEIDGVIVDTGKLDDTLMMVSVKSRAASLMWRYDRKRAQALFLDLWKYIEQQRGDAFDQNEAQTVLLKNLYPVNSSLAAQLLKERSERQKPRSTLRSQATGNDPDLRRLANISAGLVDQDPAIAARLLEQSLSIGVTPSALSVLSRMRETNPTLANYVVAQTLEQLRFRPTIVSLTGLHLLTAFVFPSEPFFADSPESGGTYERLRFQYFSIAYEVLKMSLDETDAALTKEKRYTERDLRFRAVYQGQLALVLAALAPRYGPQFVEELNLIARRLSGNTPGSIANWSKYVVARLKGDYASSDNPETNIAVAIANGDFNEARRLIDKIDDEDRKKSLFQTLAKAEFRALIAEPNLGEALNVARRIENVNLRVMLFLQLARVAYRKDDVSLSKLILSEARSALANTDKDGMRARLLLSFASEVSSISDLDAIDILHNAVAVINSLSTPNSSTDPETLSTAELITTELNDPRGFADSPDLQRAFSSVARVDFDGTLLAAARINQLSVQLMAKLATSEVALAKRVKKTDVVPEKKPSSNSPSKRTS